MKQSVNNKKGKPAYQKAEKKKNTKRNALTIVYILALVLSAICVAGYIVWQYTFKTYRNSDPAWLYIPKGASSDAVRDSLCNLDLEFGSAVSRIWSVSGGKPAIAHGAYKITNGESAISLANRLKNGRQTPVKVTFNNIRTMDQLANRISKYMEFSSEDFSKACDSVLQPMGFVKETYPAAFLPDSYEFFWTASPEKVVSSLVKVRNRFWNDERRAKASALNLSPVDVATIASIVEEETAKADERPTVARLYMNRLAEKMPLQADPTVKFAVGDFSLRRIRGNHLKINSPYNTYINKGLPPGPIRIVDARTLNQVLEAPKNNFLYMCAREDFSGYHNFARDFATHQANARRYQSELNRRGIR